MTAAAPRGYPPVSLGKHPLTHQHALSVSCMPIAVLRAGNTTLNKTDTSPASQEEGCQAREGSEYLPNNYANDYLISTVTSTLKDWNRLL